MSERDLEGQKRDLYLRASGWSPVQASDPDGLWRDLGGVVLRAKEAAERQIERQTIQYVYWAEHMSTEAASVAADATFVLAAKSLRAAWDEDPEVRVGLERLLAEAAARIKP